MIRQVDRFSMHIAPGGKGVTNRLPEKTLPVCVCYIAALLHYCCIATLPVCVLYIGAMAQNSSVVNNVAEL